jgi:DNA-binding XRE family transcriptional regulator
MTKPAKKTRSQVWSADQFKMHRVYLEWTQAEAAKALGITPHQVASIEAGRVGVTKTMAILFSAYRFMDGPEKFRGEPEEPIFAPLSSKGGEQ